MSKEAAVEQATEAHRAAALRVADIASGKEDVGDRPEFVPMERPKKDSEEQETFRSDAQGIRQPRANGTSLAGGEMAAACLT
jgi:hypothetical protein